jgi:hypothetical protein
VPSNSLGRILQQLQEASILFYLTAAAPSFRGRKAEATNESSQATPNGSPILQNEAQSSQPLFLERTIIPFRCVTLPHCDRILSPPTREHGVQVPCNPYPDTASSCLGLLNYQIEDHSPKFPNSLVYVNLVVPVITITITITITTPPRYLFGILISH